MFYDVHSHIDLVEEENVSKIINEAKEKNVGEIISCSTSFISNKKNLLLSKKYEEIKPALGLYPLDLVELNEEELNKAFNYFEENKKNIFAIGEVGLDYKYCKTTAEQEKQTNYFKKFIELSNSIKKPLIIHSRYAQSQVLKILEKKDASKVLLHSFVDSKKLMKQAIDHNYYISVGLSAINFKEVRENLVNFPIEKLLFETDSPIRFNGEKSHPSKIIDIAKKVSEIKNINIIDIEKQQEKNYDLLFH
ncbi:MAG: TatD family hydrolase [Candidatus Diapherotrites archaeon]|jgi:TatD DNase family protein|uniref:TatD family hydrolase n=1 Tax=Candidatus Iainarchaeum sp. TaxID=3101447 RepID=A0A7K4C071_9ARCH|nr:TatD family hydrolase [Candidatus Diapherotrites archaeon]